MTQTWDMHDDSEMGHAWLRQGKCVMTGCQVYLLTRLHGFDNLKAGMMGIERISEAPQKLPIITAKVCLDYMSMQALTVRVCKLWLYEHASLDCMGMQALTVWVCKPWLKHHVQKQKKTNAGVPCRHMKRMMQGYVHKLVHNTIAICSNRLVILRLPVTAAGSYFVSFVSTKPKFWNAFLMCMKCIGAACRHQYLPDENSYKRREVLALQSITFSMTSCHLGGCALIGPVFAELLEAIWLIASSSSRSLCSVASESRFAFAGLLSIELDTLKPTKIPSTQATATIAIFDASLIM